MNIDPEDIPDDEGPRPRCVECGGDGFIEYLDGGPSVWGEDCPSEDNHLVTCPHCGGTGIEP